jgi:fatty acid desaturase
MAMLEGQRMESGSATMDSPTPGIIPQPPAIAELAHLKPRDGIGACYLAGCLSATAIAISASLAESWLLWAAGQFVLAFAFLQWFVLLHECGHKTLFRSGLANRLAGQMAGYFALIPFASWTAVHGIHHRWTGWQDLDVTTASLVPRPLSGWERWAINLSWRYSIPLFSVLYRIGNYWNPRQLFSLFPRLPMRRRIVVNMLLLLAAYAGTVYATGVARLVEAVGLGLLLSLMMQDPLILSQHTHIPMELSQGRAVSPHAPAEQRHFTRSLRFPTWFARLVLINFNAHELHHMYSQVPGYQLDRVGYAPDNGISWWQWLRCAKRIPGEVFLFQNRNQTGLDL